MPVVQMYGAPRVELKPLPEVRKQAAETPTSEGAGLDQAIAEKDATAGAALGGPIERLGLDLSQKLRDRAVQQVNQTQKLAMFNGLSDWRASALFDPDTGAFAQKGINALGLPEQVKQSFDAKVNDLMQGMRTPEQKANAAQIAAEQWRSVSDDVQRHVDTEIQNYHADQATAAVTNAANAALQQAQDPLAIKKNLDIGVNVLDSYGQLHGESPDVTEQKISAFQSAVHVGVIRNLLAAGLDTQAGDYFSTVGPKGANQIAGDKLDELQAALDIGTLRGQAQKASDDIISGGGTLAQQLEKAKGLSPKLRDDVTQRLKQQYDVDQEMARQAEEQNVSQALTVLYNDPQHRVSSIPPAVLAAIPTHREMLDREAERLSRGLPTETDPGTYYTLMKAASDIPDDFVKTNLLAYKDRLDNGAFKQLVDLQTSMRRDDRKAADVALAGFRTNSQIIDDSLAQYGITAKTGGASGGGRQTDAAVAQLRRMVDEQVGTLEALTGKKPLNRDVQAIVDRILSTPVKQPGSWWGLLPFTSTKFSDSTKLLPELTIDDVPATDQAQIADALRRRGSAVNPVTILDVYENAQLARAQLARDPQLGANGNLVPASGVRPPAAPQGAPSPTTNGRAAPTPVKPVGTAGSADASPSYEYTWRDALHPMTTAFEFGQREGNAIVRAVSPYVTRENLTTILHVLHVSTDAIDNPTRTFGSAGYKAGRVLAPIGYKAGLALAHALGGYVTKAQLEEIFRQLGQSDVDRYFDPTRMNPHQ